MANASKPAGLVPIRRLDGTKWISGGNVYCIPTTDSTNAYATGDPVVLAGSADTNGIPTITLATAGTSNNVLGCITGMGGNIKYGGPFVDPTNLNTILVPVTKASNYYVLVADDPNLIFEIQEGGSGTALAAGDLGSNINLLSGTNNGYVSGWTIDNNSKATTNTYQCQLLRLAQSPNNAMGASAKWWVRINTHCFKAGTTGV